MSRIGLLADAMNSSLKYSTLAAWPLAICRALEAHGYDPASLLTDCDLDREALVQNPDGRVDIRLMTRFWDQVRQQTRDEAFGLKVADYALPLHFRALGLLMHTADSLEDALLKIGRYAAMVSNSVTIRVEQTPASLAFCIDPIAGVPISTMAIDSFFATLMRFASQLGARSPLVAQVELLRPRPAEPASWERYFEAPVIFSASQNALWFRRGQLKHGLLMGDERMAAYNESVVQAYVAGLDAATFGQQVKRLLLAQLEAGEPAIGSVASQLNLTERSLRRRLREEGLSYRELLQQSRMEMAEYYLRHTTLSVTDIALRSGFADASNFARAFTRWFSQSPTEFRKTQLPH